MDDFSFQCITKTIFGRDAELHVGEETSAFSKKVLLHYGGNSIKKSGLYDRVIASLKKAGVEYVELGGVVPNPRLSLVKEGIRICRENDLTFILAVGGGSVIDSAKSIAAGVKYDGDVWDFYMRKAKPGYIVPIGVILTFPAAGSEQSDGNVITNEDGWVKDSFEAPTMRPKFSIMNPELSFTLPPFQTAAGCMDIMAHVMERYFTCTQSVDFTDRLCEATLKTIIVNLPIVLKDPTNYGARSQIMWAGTNAQNDLLSTGRVGDWANHKMEHEISAIYDVTHGAGLAVTFPAWMDYVYKQDLSRFVQFATRVWDVEMLYDAEQTALEGIKRYRNFIKEVGMPANFKELGVTTDERFDELAARCTHNDEQPVGNFVKLYSSDVSKIYRNAL